MKKFLQFAGLISAVLAIAAFIFMMAGKALVYETSSATYFVSGTRAIFGGKEETILGTAEYKPAATALIAWILILAALVILVAGVILPLLKVTALEKVAGLLNLIAVCALVVGGILLFFTQPVFNTANKTSLGTLYDDYKLSFAFVFAAILAIAGGVIAILPAAMDFMGKKK